LHFAQGMYTLCAVVNHFGGAGGGHYTAHARCESNGKWHEFDDSHVTEVNTILVAGERLLMLPLFEE
jgi:ubiquitin C-terminal hydrolase